VGRGHRPPGASRGGTESECGNFLPHKIYKNSGSSVEAGSSLPQQSSMLREKTNHVHRTMHILDAVSSISKSSKCTEIVGAWALLQTPLGNTVFPRPP